MVSRELAMQAEVKGGIIAPALTHAPIFLNDVSIVGCRLFRSRQLMPAPNCGESWGSTEVMD